MPIHAVGPPTGLNQATVILTLSAKNIQVEASNNLHTSPTAFLLDKPTLRQQQTCFHRNFES